jgi:hypothetical protein
MNMVIIYCGFSALPRKSCSGAHLRAEMIGARSPVSSLSRFVSAMTCIMMGVSIRLYYTRAL